MSHTCIFFFKMKCRLSHSNHYFVHPVVQTASQQTWRTPSTRTSTSRSTWSLQWPASCCLQTCTAGPAASSWRATLPSRCWATTPSSRRWLSAVSTSPTRRGWSPRGTFEKGLCKWWGRFLLIFSINLSAEIFVEIGFKWWTPKRGYLVLTGEMLLLVRLGKTPSCTWEEICTRSFMGNSVIWNNFMDHNGSVLCPSVKEL